MIFNTIHCPCCSSKILCTLYSLKNFCIFLSFCFCWQYHTWFQFSHTWLWYLPEVAHFNFKSHTHLVVGISESVHFYMVPRISNSNAIWIALSMWISDRYWFVAHACKISALPLSSLWCSFTPFECNTVTCSPLCSTISRCHGIFILDTQ